MSTLEHGDWAGVDEVGRGPLAGPLVAAAVWLQPEHGIEGLRDSKKLRPADRRDLSNRILSLARAVAIVTVSPEMIDCLNIHRATLWAMQQAVEALIPVPPGVLVDGLFAPVLPIQAHAHPRADETDPPVSAASIVAKHFRDELMVRYDALFPGYGFSVHKGYPTKRHLAALESLGPCSIHRKSFAPVANRTGRVAPVTPP